MNSVFRNRWAALPRGFNVPKRVIKHAPGLWRELVANQEIFILHFVGAKPWMQDQEQRRRADWDADSQAFTSLESLWWQVRRGHLPPGPLLDFLPKSASAAQIPPPPSAVLGSSRGAEVPSPTPAVPTAPPDQLHVLLASKDGLIKRLHATIAARVAEECVEAESPIVAVHDLTTDGASWVLLVRSFAPLERFGTDFQSQWDLHPTHQRSFTSNLGVECFENRWSQAYGVSYRYSTLVNDALPLAANPTLRPLLDMADALAPESAPFNMVLQNWYGPEHTIAAHSDDEEQLKPDAEIFSFSWGASRRFVLKPKCDVEGRVILDSAIRLELWLHDGDMLIMGGTCQRTHKHTVPARRKVLDAHEPEGNRVNVTIRRAVLERP